MFTVKQVHDVPGIIFPDPEDEVGPATPAAA